MQLGYDPVQTLCTRTHGAQYALQMCKNSGPAGEEPMTVANSGPPLLREWCQTQVREINFDRGHVQRKNKRAQYNQPFAKRNVKVTFPPLGVGDCRGGDHKGGIRYTANHTPAARKRKNHACGNSADLGLKEGSMAAGLIDAPQTVCGSLGCAHDGKVRTVDPLAKVFHCVGTAEKTKTTPQSNANARTVDNLAAQCDISSGAHNLISRVPLQHCCAELHC